MQFETNTVARQSVTHLSVAVYFVLDTGNPRKTTHALSERC